MRDRSGKRCKQEGQAGLDVTKRMTKQTGAFFYVFLSVSHRSFPARHSSPLYIAGVTLVERILTSGETGYYVTPEHYIRLITVKRIVSGIVRAFEKKH